MVGMGSCVHPVTPNVLFNGIIELCGEGTSNAETRRPLIVQSGQEARARDVGRDVSDALAVPLSPSQWHADRDSVPVG